MFWQTVEMTILKTWKISTDENMNINTIDVNKNNKSSITIDMAENTAGYKVTLSFNNRDCDDKNDIMIKYGFNDNKNDIIYGNAFINALTNTHLGPDEIIIQLEGASFQSQVK